MKNISGFLHFRSLSGLILCCALSICSGTQTVAAEPAIEKNGPMLGVFFSPELGLSAQQKGEVKSILQKNREVTKDDFFAFRDSQMELRDYLRHGGSEPVKIESLTSACGAALQKLQIGQAMAFTEAYQHLSDTQKTKLASLKESR